jgi:hypothetical protein
MPTASDINKGMSLDEIIGSDAPKEVFGALRSTAVKDLNDSLNPRVPGGISELLDRLLNGDSNDEELVGDALAAAILEHHETIDSTIAADLEVQAELIRNQQLNDLASGILPQAVLNPLLLDMVTTDKFKEIVNADKQR